MKSVSLMLTGAIALSLLTLTAHARLGETKEEIAARYGAPIGDGVYPNSLKYRERGIDITVVFIDGKSACERFDTHEIWLLDHLIEANGGTKAWKLVTSNRKTLGRKVAEKASSNPLADQFNIQSNSWLVRDDGAVAFIKDERPNYIEIRSDAYNKLHPIPEKPAKPARVDTPRQGVPPLQPGQKPIF
jgi:hypothetical protein